jgi:hypothetical protein
MLDNLQSYKLICENDFNDYNILVEQQNPNQPKTLYIEGPYAVAAKKNGNGRVYIPDVLNEAINGFMTEYVVPKSSVGELNHPATTDIDPKNVCHLVESLRRDGNVWMGKSKVLRGTPNGDIFAALIENGVRLGISSRGVGVLSESKEVTKFKIVAFDVVTNPSGPGCFVNGILESKNYMVNQHGDIMEMAYVNLEQSIKTLPKHSDEKKQLIYEAFQKFMKDIRK